MESHCFIALGSNLGDRFAHLIASMTRIEQRVGRILQISRPYETVAWGFEGPVFVNACLRLETEQSPQDVLSALQTIEKELGRRPSSHPGYQSRTIDLDLLFYGTQQIDTDFLALPHPRIPIRRFVLDPLVDIAGQWVHPVLDETLQRLQQKCKDTVSVRPLVYQKWLPELFENNRYLAVAGNIGSGKTSLVNKMAADYDLKPIYEKFKENPHLPQFYKDPATFALDTENFFLDSRIAQLKFHSDQVHISDYWLEKSLLFARNNLSDKDLEIFTKRFQEKTNGVLQPDILIYLDRPVTELMANIKKRGRPYEQSITEDYLKGITQGYKEKLSLQYPFPIHVIDASGMDFVTYPMTYILLLRQLVGL